MACRVFSHLFWMLFLFLVFYISLSVSWLVLSKVDFAYPLLHDYAGIGENIDTYGPKNRVKRYFHQTSREERISLFSGIAKGIQNRGDGLEQLSYGTGQGRSIKLLTREELIHLHDVAELYDKFTLILYFSVALSLIFLIVRHRWEIPLPRKRSLLLYAVVPFAIGGVVYLLGAEKIFYQLHTLLFPVGHKWYFYYEESLMSMMMMAPYLFAYIAVMLLVLAVGFSAAIMKLYAYILHRSSISDDGKKSEVATF